jgi:hypothetical protein
MSNGSNEIIIKGGSCELQFDHGVFQQDQVDNTKRKNADLEIKHIIISGDPEFPDHDTGEHSTKFTGNIRIICR